MLKTENQSLQKRNQDLVAENARLQHTISQIEEVQRPNLLKKLQYAQQLVIELKAKLDEPLLDKETIGRMVRDDEELRLRGCTERKNLLRAQKKATKDHQKEKRSRDEWSDSVSHWQMGRTEGSARRTRGQQKTSSRIGRSNLMILENFTGRTKR
jgi:hypothetical protein